MSKAASSGGPACPSFDDSTWRVLDLPHDWAIELPFDRCADRNHGFKPVGPGFPQNNTGWYRKSFVLPGDIADRRMALVFDGVFRDATVWFNGWLIRRHRSGYVPFREDVTDLVRSGERNTVVVRVDASEVEGWFYEGAGMYRHVWLETTSAVAVAPDGIFVRSEFAGPMPGSDACVRVDVHVRNATGSAVDAGVRCDVLSPEGVGVASMKARVLVEQDGSASCELAAGVPSPRYWSPETPVLYTLVTTVIVDGADVDRVETPFGIRSVAFDPEKGFLLNGAPYLLKGTCNHQDHAGVGVALPDALQAYRVARLKEMGCNAYRTAHHPPTPELLDACDRLGMVFMDESRLLGSDSENLAAWAGVVRRDRNHPSVCIWSVGNEEFAVQSSPQGGRVAAAMQRLTKRLDPGRPVTYAAPQGDVDAGINGVIEVRGWNYNIGPGTDAYHARHPSQPNVGTEQGSILATRGEYADDAVRGYVCAYDGPVVESAEAWWSFFAERPWLSGAFLWTGFDYRGEPTPYGWPCTGSHFGALDMCGFPKDSFHYYRAWWTSEPVLHVAPHWTWPGREGQPIRVDVFSNAASVELTLNGVALGRQDMKRNSKLTWTVPYAPGRLTARSYDVQGRLVLERTVETAGPPVSVRLTRDVSGLRDGVCADGEDVAIFGVSVVDAEGREVPSAGHAIHFRLEGEARFLGVGNGDPSSHEPDVFVPQSMVSVPVTGWRWKAVEGVWVGGIVPADDPGDPAWLPVRDGTNATIGDLPLWSGREALYRATVQGTEAMCAASSVRLRFSGCNKEGRYFLNGVLLGESSRWEEHPAFDVTAHLRPGGNDIAVVVRHGGRWAGLRPCVWLEVTPAAREQEWTRRLFNGRAQVLVQSTRVAGPARLEATANGLRSAMIEFRTMAAAVRAL